MSNNIYVDTKDLHKLLKDVEDVLDAPSTMAGALNKTLKFISAETRRQVRGEYYLTKSINKTLTEKRARRSDLTAIAKYQDSPLPLFLFKNTAPNNRYRSPVTVTVKIKSGARTHTGSNPAMFRAYGRKLKLRESGHRNIHGAYTVSIPQMVANDDVYDVIAKKAEAELPKKLMQEIERKLKIYDGR